MDYAKKLERIHKRMLELNDEATYTKGQDQEFYGRIEEELEELAQEAEEVRFKRSKGL